MRILIATGIYPPEIGGPAFYAKNLSDALRGQGHQVDVVTFGALKKLPTGARHIALFLKLLNPTRRADIVIALDTFSAALPATWATRLLGKTMIVRTGGDFIWEQYVEHTGDLVPLPSFYVRLEVPSFKERLLMTLTRYVINKNFVVFSSHFQKEVWKVPYGLDEQRCAVIPNAIAERYEPIAPNKKNFLFFGRDLKLRNKKKFLEAFQNAKKIVPDIVLEVGQVPQKELIERIRACYCVVLPSISDITPNYILDAVRCGKPFILTKYSEYATQYADKGLVIDPLDPQDMTNKIIQICDESTYNSFTAHIAMTPLTRTYDDLAQDFIELAKKLI